MTETTTARDLEQALAEYTRDAYGQAGFTAAQRLADAVRARLAPLPEGEAGRMAAQAERDARTTAPPVPDVTVNGNYTVRAVLPGHPAGDGLLESWWVACQETVSGGHWVTWEAYQMDGPAAGFLAYNAGHYYGGPDPAANKREALADLAVRAGLMSGIGLRIADEVTRYHAITGPYTTGEREDRRMAARLRTWCR